MSQDNLPEDYLGESEGGEPITPEDTVRALAELTTQKLISPNNLVETTSRYLDSGDLKNLPPHVQAIILSTKKQSVDL